MALKIKNFDMPVFHFTSSQSHIGILTKERVSLNQSILKLRLFTYFLLDKKIWWFLSAVLSKMTLPNKSSSKDENRNDLISHFVDILGLYQ